MAITYTIEIKKSAQKELASLPPRIADKIIRQIKALAHDPRPRGYKKLELAEGLYRIRINAYRVVYSVFDERLVVQIIKAAHRKDIYK